MIVTEPRRPSVLFVCVRNSGKSQLAAALLRHLVADRFVVSSAGTDPGRQLNALSVASLAEIGIDVGDEHPKLATRDLVEQADLVVLLGTEAHLDTDPVPQEVWDTDEPSSRGIDGLERMRLIREDIAQRVTALAQSFPGTPG